MTDFENEIHTNPSKLDYSVLKNKFAWLKEFSNYSQQITQINSTKNLELFITLITSQALHEKKFKSFINTLNILRIVSFKDNAAGFVSYLRLIAYLMLYCSVVGYAGAQKFYESMTLHGSNLSYGKAIYPKQQYSSAYILGELLENLTDKLDVKEANLVKFTNEIDGNITDESLRQIHFILCSFPKKVKVDVNTDKFETQFVKQRNGDKYQDGLPIILPELVDGKFTSHEKLRHLKELIRQDLGTDQERIPPSIYNQINSNRLLEHITTSGAQEVFVGVDFKSLL